MFEDKASLRLNIFFAILSGLIFALGWWFFIDAVSVSASSGFGAGRYYEYFSGVFSTIGHVLISNLPDYMFHSDSFGYSDTPGSYRLILAISIIFLLGGVVSSLVIFFESPLFKNGTDSTTKWRGIAEIIQCSLITASALLWRFAYKDREM